MIVEEAIIKYKRNKFSRLQRIYINYLHNVDINSAFDFITIAEKGIGAGAITLFAGHFKLERDIVACVLDTSEPTVYRWVKNNKMLDMKTSIRLLEISNLFLTGEDVFEDKENFFTWLSIENLALGGMSPLQLMALPEGISKVNDLLTRIEYGVYS